jgi:hypothetical protein
MATNKKPLTKAQISSHIAETAGITKKAANEILDDIASLAYVETKKKGEKDVKPEWVETLPQVRQLKSLQRKLLSSG